MTVPFGSPSAFFDFSARVKLRVTGSDCLRFLNGQLTNDVRKLTDSSAMEACVLNAKGKMNAHVFLRATADSLFLDADPQLRESLQPRLERYIIADDVRIEDVSGQFSIFHVLSSNAIAWPKQSKIISASRFTESGRDIWVDAAQHGELFQQLSEEFSFCDADCAEVFRVEQGIPRWGHELTEEIIPIEANLEERTIDYEKGCYIGQETISRMKMSGQRNKKLCGLVSLHDAPLVPGMKLFPAGAERKEIGWITSAARSDRLQKEIALGYIKRGFNLATSQVNALAAESPFGSAAVRAEIVDLPFK